MTLTRTFAWRRSGCVSTSVIVANPIRGSSTSRLRIAPISCRNSSSIRSVRAVTERPRAWTGRQRVASPHAPYRALATTTAPGRSAGRSAGKHPGDGLRGEAFDDVPLLEVVVAREADAALVVLGDLPDVVSEPAERLDPVGDHDLAVPPDASAAADDPPVGDEAAGDDGALADAEDLADLRAALDDLDDLGLEQALERCRHVVGQLVDDVVQPDVHTLGVGGPAGRLGDLRVEADDDRVGRRRKHDVVVGDVAGALVEDVDPDLLLVELLERVADRTERSRHVGLEDDPELLRLTRLDLAVEVLERCATARVAGLRRRRRTALLDHRPGFLLVADDAEDVARLGHLGQTEDDDGARGPRLRDPLAPI